MKQTNKDMKNTISLVKVSVKEVPFLGAAYFEAIPRELLRIVTDTLTKEKRRFAKLFPDVVWVSL